MSMNPIRVKYNSTGAKAPVSIDWRDAPSGCSLEIEFDNGATGSVDVETTLDDVNQASIVPVWTKEITGVSATGRSYITHPVQFLRLNISSLSGGGVTLKVLVGAPLGADAAGGGGGNSTTLVGAQARSANVIVGDGDTTPAVATLAGAIVVRPYSIPEGNVATEAPMTLTDTNQPALAAPADPSECNYLTGLLLTCNSTWTENTIILESDATVLAEFGIPAGIGVHQINIWSQSPLRGAPGEAINIRSGSAATGTCMINATGFQAP